MEKKIESKEETTKKPKKRVTKKDTKEKVEAKKEPKRKTEVTIKEKKTKNIEKITIKPVKKEEKIETVIVDKNASFNLLEVIIIILMTGLVVGVSTGILVYKNYNKIEATANNKPKNYLKEFDSAYNNILNSYIEKIDGKELLDAAISGMYNYLGDPYTGFLNEATSSDLNERLVGEYKGIGIEITKVEEGILVVTVFPNTPAEKIGLSTGDIIVKIDGVDISNMDAEESSKMIKNSNKEKVELSYLRSGITITKTLDVKKVYVPSIKKENYDSVGYIKIDTFSGTTAEQFETALKELEKDGINSLVIDVRGNGGGYLSAAVDIAELFIEKGKNIYGLEKKTGTKFYEDTTNAKRDYKVAVLMNSGSASASEILAASLKESYGATLVGTVSYGKGTVQETKELESGGMIKYTTAYWLTPNGAKIDGIGLKPDHEVNAPYSEDLTLENDTQLKEAINIVK